MRLILAILVLSACGRVDRACSLPVRVAPEPALLRATQEAIKRFEDEYFEIANTGYKITLVPDLVHPDTGEDVAGLAYHSHDVSGCLYEGKILVELNHVGLVAHELGHLLALKDIYDEEMEHCLMYAKVGLGKQLCDESKKVLDKKYNLD